MTFDITQGTTQRGIIRVLVAIAASLAWYFGDTDKAVGAFVVGESLKGWLGIVDEK